MTNEDIIRIAQECQLIGMRPHLDGIYEEALQRFAALVAAAEREQWIDVAEQAMEALALFSSDESDEGMMAIAAHESLRAAIRAMGEK
jgi:hypothetical protein